jgi:hypothetical protein
VCHGKFVGGLFVVRGYIGATSGYKVYLEYLEGLPKPALTYPKPPPHDPHTTHKLHSYYLVV